jgi:hypothetical protein
MKRVVHIVAILLLLAAAASPRVLAAQAPRGRTVATSTRGFDFDRNIVNPVRPGMWIPFYLDEKLFDGADSVAVSIRIHNILNNVVAIPVLRDPFDGRESRNIEFVFRTPGKKMAYWDGKDLAGRAVSSGVFYWKMTVGEESSVLKVVVDNPVRRRSILPWLRR